MRKWTGAAGKVRGVQEGEGGSEQRREQEMEDAGGRLKQREVDMLYMAGVARSERRATVSYCGRGLNRRRIRPHVDNYIY